MYFPGKDFTRVKPEAAGISSSAITRALREIDRSGKSLHSMLILRDGRMVFEHYFAPYTSSDNQCMYSCSKTFTSMLVGIAQGKGLLSIHDKLLSYFPEVEIENLNDYLREMTLRDLLIMGSGHGEDTIDKMRESDDWAKVFLNLPVTHKPGTHFVYNTGAAYMLSVILTKLTGKNAFELAREWIFEKIGADPEKWDCCPKGYAQGGTGLHAKPTDMARLGLLISNNGAWDGEQIIPADYIAEAREKQIDNSHHADEPNWQAGYGYQMWRCAFKAFRADGFGGQYIVMMPEMKLVFVFTSALGADINFPLTIIRKTLLPSIKNAEIPEDDESYEELLLEAEKTAQLPSITYGVRYAFAEKNTYNIKSIKLDEDNVTIEAENDVLALDYGVNHFRKTAHGDCTLCTRLRLRGGDIELTTTKLGEVVTFVYKLAFSGDKLRMSVKCNLGEASVIEGVRA